MVNVKILAYFTLLFFFSTLYKLIYRAKDKNVWIYKDYRKCHEH